MKKVRLIHWMWSYCYEWQPKHGLHIDICHGSIAGIKDGKDGDEGYQVDVWCFPERKTSLALY